MPESSSSKKKARHLGYCNSAELCYTWYCKHVSCLEYRKCVSIESQGVRYPPNLGVTTYRLAGVKEVRMATGKVKWFSESKGYGFIAMDDGTDLFVHYSGIRGTGRRNLQEGQEVEFEIVEGPKGPQASDVVVL